MPTTFDSDAYPHGSRLDSEAREAIEEVKAVTKKPRAKKAAKTRAKNEDDIEPVKDETVKPDAA